MAQSYQAFDASSLQPFGASTPRMHSPFAHNPLGSPSLPGQAMNPPSPSASNAPIAFPNAPFYSNQSYPHRRDSAPLGHPQFTPAYGAHRTSAPSLSADHAARLSTISSPIFSAVPQYLAAVGPPPARIIKQVPALTPAEKARSASLGVQVQAIPTRRCNNLERTMHQQWAQKRNDEELAYCIKHRIRLDNLRSIIAPITRQATQNPWNEFMHSKYFEDMLVRDHVEVPTNLIQRQNLAKPYWKAIGQDEEAKIACDAALASEREEPTDDPPPNKSTRIKPLGYKTIKRGRQCLEDALNTISVTYAEKYGLQMLAMASSNLPELNKERFLITSPGGLAFAHRKGWGDDSGSKKLLSEFADCVTGRAFLEEKKAELDAAVWGGPPEAENTDTKCKWYSAILKKLFDDALMRRAKLEGRTKLQGRNFKTPRLVYDQDALVNKARIVVECGSRLNLATDFVSPSGKQKMSGTDLDRIIPLLRAGELRFRLLEEVVAEADAGAAATAATGVDDSASELSRSSGRQQTPEEQDGGML